MNFELYTSREAFFFVQISELKIEQKLAVNVKKSIGGEKQKPTGRLKILNVVGTLRKKLRVVQIENTHQLQTSLIKNKLSRQSITSWKLMSVTEEKRKILFTCH